MLTLKNYIAILGIVLVSATNSLAFPTDLVQKTVTVNYENAYKSSTGGGEFHLDVGSDKNTANDYFSFCVEKRESITTNVPYNIDTVSDMVTSGGIDLGDDKKGDTTPGYDPLSSATQWVVYTYFYGSFTALGKTTTYKRGDSSLADYVQNVIWYLEDEIQAPTSRTASPWWTFYTDYVQGKTNKNYDDYVTVLNLVTKSGGNAQSQIIAEPVPEPATMLLFGSGLISFSGIIRRRMRS